MQRRQRALWSLLCSLALLSCSVSPQGGGGSFGGGSGGGMAGGGIGGTGIVMGPVTGFGSVFVNGIEFDTTGATITLNGVRSQEADLQVGQIVTVMGTINDARTAGSAMHIVFENDSRGTVEAIDLVAQSLTVLGQLVLVDDLTKFGNTTLETLRVGNLVAVSGFLDANGALRASRIDLEADAFSPGETLELKGTIARLNRQAQTFELNLLTVDFSQARLVDVFLATLANGQFVKVRTTRAAVGGVLLADRVELEEQGIDGEDGDEVDLEGVITSFTSTAQFSVNGQPVVTTAQTQFEDGTAADLALNVQVEVEGVLNANLLLLASEVKIRRTSEIRLEGNVDSVSPSTSSLVLQGVTVSVDTRTRFEDESQADLRTFSLDDIRPGDFLRIIGIENPPGSTMVRATRLERRDADAGEERELRGVVESVATSAFVVLGVQIEVTAETRFKGFAGTSPGGPLPVRPGQLVRVKGQQNGTTFVAVEVELRD